MKQLDFEHKYRDFWLNFSRLLDQLEKVHDEDELCARQWPEFPAQYRKLCQHLSLAQTRQYSPRLTDQLHALVLRGHQHLYQAKPSVMAASLRFIARTFPQALRADWRVWLIASLMFYLPGIFMALMCYSDPDFIRTIMSYSDLQQLEYMYNPATEITGRAEGRQADSDFYMFGYYVMNNVGIDFRAYASGIFFGIGSAFFMIFNGLNIGAAAGHLSQQGYTETFWGFVAGHSALELTAATIAGAAGLKLGYALINPGRYSRALALRKSGSATIPLITGAALMTFLAAFVEGFWSATAGVPAEVKYSVGILAWIAVFAYLLLAGRNS